MDANRAAAQSRVAWWPLVVVLVVIALLTGGWTLAAALVPDSEPISAGTRLEVGPGREATVTVANDGWRVRRAATNPDQSYALTRGDVDLSINYVDLPAKPSPDELWTGFRQVTRTSGGRLGEPSTMTTRAGQSGQSGPIRRGDRTGTAYAVPAADGTFAIELTVLGADHAATADVSAAEQIVQSLTFHGGGA